MSPSCSFLLAGQADQLGEAWIVADAQTSERLARAQSGSLHLPAIAGLSLLVLQREDECDASRGENELGSMGLMVVTAAAQSPHRLVVVVGSPTDPRVAQQRAFLENDASALRERDVIVQDMTPEDARRERPELTIPTEAVFQTLLVGKDGGVKLRRTDPVAASEIIALIDTMPMRKNEMRR